MTSPLIVCTQEQLTETIREAFRAEAALLPSGGAKEVLTLAECAALLGRIHLDATLAPVFRPDFNAVRPHERVIGFVGEVLNKDERHRAHNRWQELPQGKFLRHALDNGFTAISWWDRCQGDERGACNSTLLLEGEHTSSEMLEALERYFPHVLTNLHALTYELVDSLAGVNVHSDSLAKLNRIAAAMVACRTAVGWTEASDVVRTEAGRKHG